MAEALVKDLIEDVDTERRVRRLAVRELRPRRVVAGFVAALLVTVTGAVAAIELLGAALGSGVHPVPGVDAAADALRPYAWHDPAILVGAVAVALLGVLFLLAALPGRPRGVALAGSDPRLAGAIGRAPLRRALVDAALDVPGIERARVRRLFRRGLVVQATTHYRNPANLAELIQRAVDERLDRIGPMRRPDVDVRLGWRED
ncbi:hypothetical protein GCM10022254_28660 [Actinomadura meridiana]|uniref:DUF6286 domain-containing protein n=1 Tax=Actinomadura meridiana TaxID=559626 RepID=A0ABP8C0Q5_9ACTN